jgi:hypothetical protein
MHRFQLPHELVWMVLEWIFESRKCGDVIANVDRVKSACESVTRAANYMARFWLPLERADEVLFVHLSNDRTVEIRDWQWDAALVAEVLGI